jgi:low temperature requirement protein LtrA
MSGAVIYLSQMMAGSVLVLIGGFVAEDLRPWFWVGAVVLNVASSIVVEKFEFDLAAAHFAERHGLFVIIVLGEALIAIGINTVGDPGSVAFFVAGTAVLLTVLAMWWSYFDWVFRTGERALKAAVGIARGRIARDAYSLSHYPLVTGVILFAVGTEELLLHPEVALDRTTRWAFLGGLILYLGSQSVMVRRFNGSITWERLILIGVLVFGGLTASEMQAATLGALVAVALATTLGVETVRHQQQLSQLRQSS